MHLLKSFVNARTPLVLLVGGVVARVQLQMLVCWLTVRSIGAMEGESLISGDETSCSAADWLFDE